MKNTARALDCHALRHAALSLRAQLRSSGRMLNMSDAMEPQICFGPCAHGEHLASRKAKETCCRELTAQGAREECDVGCHCLHQLILGLKETA